MTSTTRLTHTLSVQAKRSFYALLAFIAVLLVSTLVRGQTRAVVFELILLAFVLLGALSIRKAATVLTPSGISQEGGTHTTGAVWSDITDIAVVGDGNRRRVRVVAKSGSLKLRVPLGSAPDFDEAVEQIRAAWLAAKDLPPVSAQRPSDPGDGPGHRA